MREIKLSQTGKNSEYVALIDDEDYERVSAFNWQVQLIKGSHRVYAGHWHYENGKNKFTGLHRFLLGIIDSKIQVDHKDGNCLNNQKANLRPCNHSQNAANRFKRKNKYVGVWQCRNKWQARVVKNQKRYFLGTYDTPEKAALAYNAAAIEKHGEFARLNVIKT